MRTRATAAVLWLLVAMASGQTPGGIWLDVPFVAQPNEGCGAASLSMLMQYWAAQLKREPGPDSETAGIQRLLYSPREHGIEATAMTRYLQDHGYQAFAFSGKWQDLENYLRKGRPLIVALKPRGQAQLHYVVVDGIDSAKNLVMFNDPAGRKLLSAERAAFERDWSATHNWLLLAVPTPASR